MWFQLQVKEKNISKLSNFEAKIHSFSESVMDRQLWLSAGSHLCLCFMFYLSGSGSVKPKLARRLKTSLFHLYFSRTKYIKDK